MPSNRLILRSTASPYIFPLSDIVKGSVLSWNEVDNNFIFLKGLNIQNGSVNGSDLVLNRINGDTINIDLSAFTGGTGTDVFVTGGTYNSSASTITFTNNTGGTFTVTGISGFTGTDYYTTGFTFNPANYDLTVSLNNGNDLTQNLGILAGDLKVTGGTYNPANGVATFTNNSGGTFQVTGFLTGYTDIYTTGVTLNGNSIEFDRTDTPNAYSVDLSPILSGFSGTDVFVTGGTYSSSASTITFTNNTGGTFTVTGISGGTSGSTASPAGSDTFIQFNDGGSFGANSGLTYNYNTNVFKTESINGNYINTFENGKYGITSSSGITSMYYQNTLSGSGLISFFLQGDLTSIGANDYATILGYTDVNNFERTVLNLQPSGFELSYLKSSISEESLIILDTAGIRLFHETGTTQTGIYITNEFGVNAILSDTGQTQSFNVQRETSPSTYTNYLTVDTNGYVTINDLYTFPNADGSTGQILQTDGSGNVSWANPYIGGLFSQTGDSVTVSATTDETSILGGGVGTLTVPANTFQVGDSFHCKIGGNLSAANSEDLTIRIKSGLTTLASFTVDFVTSNWPSFWELEIDFTIRSTGITGVIQTNSQFNYIGTGGGTTYEGFGYNTNATIDTTSSNTLDITVEWASNNAGNAIYSDIFYLHKVY